MRRQLPPLPEPAATVAPDPAENPTAVRISDGAEFGNPLGANLTDEDGNAVDVDLRNGQRALVVRAPETERALDMVLDRLDAIDERLKERNES